MRIVLNSRLAGTAPALLAWLLIAGASVFGQYALPAWIACVALLGLSIWTSPGNIFSAFAVILFSPVMALPFGLFLPVVGVAVTRFVLRSGKFEAKPWRGLFVGFLGLCLLYLAGAIHSPAPELAQHRASQALQVIFVLVAVAPASTSISRTQHAETVWIIVAALSLGTKLLHVELGDSTSLFQIAESAARSGFDTHERVHLGINGELFARLIYPGQEPNYTGAILLFPAALALRRSVEASARGSRWLAALLMLCSVSIGYQIIGTFSRSAALSLCFLVLYFSFSTWRRSPALVVGFVASVAVFLVSHEGSLLRLASMQSSLVDEGATGRFDFWRAAYDLSSQHPILGGGLGSFQAAVGDAVHNTYLEILVDLGLIGLAVFAAAACVPVAHLWRARRDIFGGGYYLAGYGAMLTMIATITLHDLKLLVIPAAFICWVSVTGRTSARKQEIEPEIVLSSDGVHARARNRRVADADCGRAESLYEAKLDDWLRKH